MVEQKAVTLALVVILDLLGTFSHAEMVQALIVDALDAPTAQRYLRTAARDGEVTDGQWQDLSRIYQEQWAESPVCELRPQFVPRSLLG